MPQGDPLSPLLFNIFMDSLIRQINVNPSQGLVSLFVDDVLVLEKSVSVMQNMLDSCVRWSTKVQMDWTVQKCSAIGVPTPISIQGIEIPSQDHPTYLGVSMGNHGLTEHRLLQRMEAVSGMLDKLRRVVGSWETTVRQLRMFVKTFVYSLVDYLLYLQPVTQLVQEKAENLDINCLSFIPRMPIHSRTARRASFLTRVLPIRGRKKRQLIRVVAKFYAASISNSATMRDQRNWHIISNYSTASPFLRVTSMPKEVAAIPEWTRTQLSTANEAA